jgi:WD40 repeat protein
MIAAVPAPAPGWGGFVAVWSAQDGALLPGRRVEPGRFVQDVIFTPDSRHLVVSFVDGSLEKWSSHDWEVVGDRLELEDAAGVEFFGFGPDSTTVIALSGYQAGNAALHWIDSATLAEARPRMGAVQDSNPTAIALSPSRMLLAAGGQDGAVRVWDAATGALRHQVSLGETGVLAVSFVTDVHLAVVLTDGHLRLVTIDADELLEIIRGSLTEGFSESECARFNFGDDCPSLEELRAG